VSAVTYEPADFVSAILARYVTGGTLVDVGCGPGLYRDATAARYIGVDSVPDSYGAASPVDVIASAEELPFEDGSVDAVMSKSALYGFPDIGGALAEFHRILKPGGTLLLFDYNRRTQKVLARNDRTEYPCWTGFMLRRRVGEAGFVHRRLLLPREPQPSGVKRLVRLVREELEGQWAIVVARKPTVGRGANAPH